MWENKFTLLQVSTARETRKFTYLAVCRSTNYLFKFSLNPFNSNIRHSRVSPTGAKTENHKQYISKLLTARVTGSTLGNLGSNTHAKYCSYEPGLRVRHIYFREKSGNFLSRCGAFRLSVSLTPSFHVSGKPRKGLAFHCFLTDPKFPIPPIGPQPPQRYRPFDFERGYSDFTKKYPADDFERKKILQGILAIQWLCVSGEKPGDKILSPGVWGKKFLHKPNPPPPPPPPPR